MIERSKSVILLASVSLAIAPFLALPLPNSLAVGAVEFAILVAMAKVMTAPLGISLQYSTVILAPPMLLSVLVDVMGLDSLALAVPLLFAAELLVIGGSPIQFLRYDGLEGLTIIHLIYMYNREVRYYRGFYNLRTFAMAFFLAFWLLSLAFTVAPAGLIAYLLVSLLAGLLLARYWLSPLREKPLFRVGA